MEKSKGQVLYEQSVMDQPKYHDGGPRKTWEQLPDFYKKTWEKASLHKDEYNV